jgi:DnaJ-class molecular chaperone
MAEKDPYKLLGVRWNATGEMIGKAYRSKIRQYHPDVNQQPEAEEKFQEIQQAFETLADPAKRAAYDHATTRVQRRPAKGVFNPRKLAKPPARLAGKSELILVNVIGILLMIFVSAAVFGIVLGVKGASPPAPATLVPQDKEYARVKARWKIDLRDASQIVVVFVDIPFLAIIGSLNLGYFITHRY